MPIENIKEWAEQQGITLTAQSEIAEEASKNITRRFNYTDEQIKENFDDLLVESEKEAYKIFLRQQEKYGRTVLEKLVEHLSSVEGAKTPAQMAEAISKHFDALDKFYLSLAQSRKSRAGRTFENIHNSLFKTLGYPFEEQAVINGKPDFLMPSIKHYRENAMDCIIFTSKRTLRERWRQIVTEGTRGLGFFLATIDDQVSPQQLEEMREHRIYLVVPEKIKAEFYSTANNVMSFREFFDEHLDPKVKIWRKKGIA